MKSRIAIWAVTGALVVVFWAHYMIAIFPAPLRMARTLMELTCPIALVHPSALGVYSVLLVNAATYALVGIVVETIRRQRQTHLIPG